MSFHITPHILRCLGEVRSWIFQVHLNNAVFALVLLFFSTVFVEFFVYFSSEYGATSTSLEGLCRLDCGWYSSIVQGGYHIEPVGHEKGDAANWAFFPAFPLAAKVISYFTGVSERLALVLTSKIFLFFAIWAFMVLVEEELGPEVKMSAGLILSFNPYIIYAHAGYTESLYFLATTLSFLFLRRREWVYAGIAGGLLSATRLVGIIFAISYLLNIRRYFNESSSSQWSKYILGLFIIPLGLALYMVYLHIHVGDALAFKHVQIAWGRSIGNPLSVLTFGISAGGVWERVFALLAIASLFMSLWLAIQRRFDYAIFLAGSTLIPLATGLWSMPRYVFWQMPFIFSILQLVSMHRFVYSIYFILAGGVGAVIIVSWVSGKSFVI